MALKCHNHNNRWGRRAFVDVIIVVVVANPPQGKISHVVISLLFLYSPSVSKFFSPSTSYPVSFLILLLLIRWLQQRFNQYHTPDHVIEGWRLYITIPKSLPPSPPPKGKEPTSPPIFRHFQWHPWWRRHYTSNWTIYVRQRRIWDRLG